MPTPIEFVDGPLPDDRMPEDFPDAVDAWFWDDTDTIGGVPVWVYEDAAALRGEG